MQQGINSGNMLAFSSFATSPRYLAYSDEVLHGDTESKISEVQNHIPPGRPFVAWVSAPFYFNYARNVIFDVNPGGLESPWAYIPQEAEYLVLQYTGFAVRPINDYYEQMRYRGRQHYGESCLAFLRVAQELSQGAETVFNNGEIVVLKIKK
jgi:hypothetical protein